MTGYSILLTESDIELAKSAIADLLMLKFDHTDIEGEEADRLRALYDNLDKQSRHLEIGVEVDD